MFFVDICNRLLNKFYLILSYLVMSQNKYTCSKLSLLCRSYEKPVPLRLACSRSENQVTASPNMRHIRRPCIIYLLASHNGVIPRRLCLLGLLFEGFPVCVNLTSNEIAEDQISLGASVNMRTGLDRDE